MERKVCFISDAGNQAGMGEDSPQADSSPPNEQGVRAFTDGVGRGRGAYMQNQHSQLWQASSNRSSVVWPEASWSFGAQWIFSCRVHSSPLLYGQTSELWQLMSCVQSSHHVVNFSTWCFNICKTVHRMWLRILSTALEKELRVLDCVQWLPHCYVASFCQFSFASAFLTSLIKLILWLVFHRQKAGRDHGGGEGAWTTASCSISLWLRGENSQPHIVLYLDADSNHRLSPLLKLPDSM